MFAQAGKVGPAYCTGVGKAMLAYVSDEALDRAIHRQSFHRFTPHTLDTPAKLRAELEAIRRRGHAFDREEHEPGIICCAVPILTRTGRVIGALSVTSTTARTTIAALESGAGRITTFDPAEIESRWYGHWEANGLFAPERPGADPWTLVNPPPNVTGVLHMVDVAQPIALAHEFVDAVFLCHGRECGRQLAQTVECGLRPGRFVLRQQHSAIGTDGKRRHRQFHPPQSVTAEEFSIPPHRQPPAPQVDLHREVERTEDRRLVA